MPSTTPNLGYGQRGEVAIDAFNQGVELFNAGKTAESATKRGLVIALRYRN